MRQFAREPSWVQFAAWALCGGCAALVLLAAFAVDPLALVPAVVFAGVALLAGGANVSVLGTAVGVGCWGFVVGWLNRDGPGEVCTSSGSGSTCTQEYAPWPSFLAGALVVAFAVVGFAVLRRRSRQRRSTA